MTRCGGRLGALENHCPHQGGPLGEGSIEKGLLRCPWHGYDYDPATGAPPGALAEHLDDRVPAYEVEEGADGVRIRLPDHVAPARTVADVLVETLVAHGIDTVFGMVGHSNLGFADALRRAEERGELRFVGIRHEGAAAFAASAYGKLTGRPAACFAIAGPGSTNLLTGLYDAKLDGAPVVAISGQVPSKVLGRGAFQDLDLGAVFRDVAISTATVQAGSDHAELAALAVKHARDGRGVAHLVLPDEVQAQPSEAPAGSPDGRYSRGPVGPDPDALARATAARGRRPAPGDRGRPRRPRRPRRGRRAGRAARGAGADDVQGQGAGPGHPPAGGRRARPQRHPGRELADERGGPAARRRCVVLQPHRHRAVADDRAGRRHPDRDRPLRRRHRRPARRRRARPARARAPPSRRRARRPRTSAATWPSAGRSGAPRRRAGSPTTAAKGVSAAAVFAALSEHLPEDAVVAVDVGNHAYSLGRYLESKGQPVLMSGYLGSIGFGYPAAMGAWAADPTRPVVAVTGDGGFGQYAMELTTAVHHGIPVKHVLLNNNALGKISKEQLAADYPVWHTSLTNPDWAAYAELCGARGLKVTHRDQLDAAMAELFAIDGPALLCVEQDAELL